MCVFCYKARLMKLTIPGQPVGCSPCQRPTPLPGRSAGKHRCSQRANVTVGMLQFQQMLDEWLGWSGLVREMCEGEEATLARCCAICAVTLYEGWVVPQRERKTCMRCH